MMKRLLIFSICFFLLFHNAFTQTIFDSLEFVDNLIRKKEYSQADSLLNVVESQCITNPEEYVQYLFNEKKGRTLFGLTKFRDCIPYFQDAISILENNNVKKTQYLFFLEFIGYSYGCIQDYDNAEKYYRKAFLRSRIIDGADWNYQNRLYKTLGDIYRLKNDTILVQEWIKYEEQPDFHGIGYLNWQNRLWEKAFELEKQNRYEEAEIIYEKLINAIKTYEVGISDTLFIAQLHRAKILSMNLNRQSEAQSLCDELITKKKEKQSNRFICHSYCLIAYSYANCGDLDNLGTTISDGFKYLSSADVSDYPPSKIYYYAGDGAYMNEYYSLAIEYYERYIMSLERNSNDIDNVISQLSKSYIVLGFPQKTVQLLEGYLKRQENRLLQEKSTMLSSLYHNLGRAYMLQGKRSNAIAYLEKSKNLQIKLYGQAIDLTLMYINECEAL